MLPGGLRAEGGVKSCRPVSRCQVSFGFLSGGLRRSSSALRPLAVLLVRRWAGETSGSRPGSSEANGGATGFEVEGRTARTETEGARPEASEGARWGSTLFSGVMKEKRRGPRPEGIVRRAFVCFQRQGGAAIAGDGWSAERGGRLRGPKLSTTHNFNVDLDRGSG